MNKMIKIIILVGAFFCLGVAGTCAYAQVEQEEDINTIGFPTDEVLLGGESQKEVKPFVMEEKTSVKTTGNIFQKFQEIVGEKAAGKESGKSLKEMSVKRKIAEKEPVGNLHQRQKMSQYPEMDIAGQMKKMRALQLTGRGFWITGTVLVATGFLLMSDPYWGSEVPATIMAGFVFVGTGIPLDVIYTRKYRALNSSHLASLDFGSQKYGVGFGLRF